MAKGSAEITAHGTANWFAGTKLKLRHPYKLPTLPSTVSPSTNTLCYPSPSTLGISHFFKLQDWQQISLQPSSVSIDEVCAVSSKVAYCCWCWLKHHQSLSRWLWMLHKSAYMRAVSNNNRSLMHPPLNLRWKMQHCQQDPLLVLQTSTSIKVSFQTLQKVLS